jgi:BirA family biotin operon repressor/biotin-[acetyl-CoA-carboxylase] ligase
VAFDQQQLESLVAKYDDAHLKLCFHIFDTLPSTNQKLWELIDQGAKPGTVVIATQQTSGRGQWGRQWHSATGGLYLSLAIAPNLPAANSAQLTLCSAWGIATALRDRAIPVVLKWPNDLILLNRKLGGILIETRVQQGHITQAIIGVGINWTNPVPETGINLQSFLNSQPTSSITSLERLAALTLEGLLSGCQRSTPEAIETVLPSYLELLNSNGRPVVVDGNPGVVVGVTPTGNLRVHLHSGSATSTIDLQPGTISLGYDP